MSNNPLLEVRKAYRLLFDYQSRILDLMKYIGQTYEIPFVKGDPKFSGRGQNKLDNWSWDWLYMYYYSFHFSNGAKKTEDKLHLSVFLLNDSGFFDAKLEDTSIKRTDVENFKSVENSNSKLIFVAGIKEWDWWNKTEILGTDFTTKETGESDDNNMVWKSYDLNLFFTEESALSQLQNFSNYCVQRNITITIEDKTVK